MAAAGFSKLTFSYPEPARVVPNVIVTSDVSRVAAATYNGASKTEAKVEEGWLSV